MTTEIAVVIEEKRPVLKRWNWRQTSRLVGQLESQLAQKDDALVQAINDRDAARNERDEARRWAQEDRAAYAQKEREFHKDLSRIDEARTELSKRNLENFGRATRNENIAAALVSCLVMATGKAPHEAMLMFIDMTKQMGVFSDVLEDVRNAFKRGYDAQVDLVVNFEVDSVNQEVNCFDGGPC